MPDKTYTIAEIQNLIQPVAKRYGVERVFLFGSYARGEATPKSDIDLRIDSGAITDYIILAGFHREISEQFSVPVDVLTTGSLDDKFMRRIEGEEVRLYEQYAQ